MFFHRKDPPSTSLQLSHFKKNTYVEISPVDPSPSPCFLSHQMRSQKKIPSAIRTIKATPSAAPPIFVFLHATWFSYSLLRRTSGMTSFSLRVE